jgi:PhnB protein
MEIQPYLFFNGRCEEAVELYRRVLGAKVEMLMRFGESPVPPEPGRLPPTIDKSMDKKVMHAAIRIGESTVLMTDGPTPEPGFRGFSLSLSLSDVVAVERIFAGLAEGGQVRMPLEKTFFAARFGMLTDRFGVGWTIQLAA